MINYFLGKYNKT